MTHICKRILRIKRVLATMGYSCSNKMAGVWLTKVKSIKKSEKGKYPAILNVQAWSVKDLVIWLFINRTEFIAGRIPSGDLSYN